MSTHSRILTFIACLVASALEPAASQPSAAFDIVPGRVGAIVIGMSVDDFYLKVGRDRTRLVDQFWEGLFDPAVEVRLSPKASSPNLVAKVGASACGFTVGMVIVHDPRFRLASGIHVGSSFGELRRLHRVEISKDEGLRAYSTELHMAFEIDSVADAAKVREIWVSATPASPTCSRK